MRTVNYGCTKRGEGVTSFTLQNTHGLEVRCLSYGCTITHILLPDASGKQTDIVLGHDTLEAYVDDPYLLGRFVGRYANRIAGAGFWLDGVYWPLTKNDGDHFLHGSLHRRVFQAEASGTEQVTFFYRSPHGEDGFPGTLSVTVTYMLTECNSLVMETTATTTAATHVNFTQHSYYNLAGADSPSLAGQELWLASDAFLQQTPSLLSLPCRLPAQGAFDFRTPKPILQDILSDEAQVQMVGGYSHCFLLDGYRENATDPRKVASVTHRASGRGMALYTTKPALQFYTANSLNGSRYGKGGSPLRRHGAFCLETEHLPDTPNVGSQHGYPPTLLLPGATYRHTDKLLFTLG